MKTKLSHVLAAGCCIVFFALNSYAQDVIILDQVKSPEDYTTIDLVRMDKNLTTFAQLVSLAGMTEQLENARPHTLLVPNNAAFDDMSVKRFAQLIDTDNKDELTKFINFYFLPKEIKKADFKYDDVIQVGFDKGIPVSVNRLANDEVSIGGSKIIKADIQASNGIVDILNRVIIPDDEEEIND